MISHHGRDGRALRPDHGQRVGIEIDDAPRHAQHRFGVDCLDLRGVATLLVRAEPVAGIRRHVRGAQDVPVEPVVIKKATRK